MNKRLIQIGVVLAAVLVAIASWSFLNSRGAKETFQFVNSHGTIDLVLHVPDMPIDIASDRISELGLKASTAYKKSAIRNCATYEEWTDHVSELYAQAMGVTEAGFNTKLQSPPQMKKEGVIKHWVTASNKAVEMLYIIESVKYQPNLPEATAVRLFVASRGGWVAHTRDELGLINRLNFTSVETLKSGIATSHE